MKENKIWNDYLPEDMQEHWTCLLYTSGSDRWEGSWRFDREGIEETEGRDWYDLSAFQSADAEVSD